MVPRVPSWTKGVAVAVLRVPPRPFVDKRCCSCSSPWSSVALRGQKVLQLQFSVSLRGPSWTKGVAVLQFSVVLRVPSWTKGVAVAVLRVPPRPFVDKKCCSCSSPWSSVALRGQKVLQLQFSVSLRGSSWTKGVAVAVLRVPPWLFVDKRCCSSAVLRVPPWPFVDKRCCSSAVLRVPPWLFVDKRCCSSAVLRGPPWPFVDKRCCSCSSPCPSVALRGQKVLQLQFSVVLRGPSWTKGVAVLQFSVSLRGPSWTKGVAVAVLRVPPWLFVDKRCCSSAVLRVPPWPFVDKRCCSCSSPCPSVDQKTVLPALSCILVDE